MLWRFLTAPLTALLVLLPMLASETLAQYRDRDRGPPPGFDRGPDRGRDAEWQLLGKTHVRGFRVDRDIVNVGRDDGRFTRIGVEAREGSPFIIDVIVVYGNNETERFDLRRPLREGERISLDLRGRDRAIKRIEITARTGRGPRHRAELGIWGEQVRDDWELLGRKDVGFGVDRDVIRVGRHEGRFSKIALEVQDNDIEIRDFRVFFRHGPPQEVRVRERIRAGGRTRPIDLEGGARVIERIELVYRSRPGARGRATVLVYGRQAVGGPPPPPPPPRRDWEELGCGKVGIKPDRDVIRVGRREGRFGAIQLRVRGNRVNILDLRVIYDRGPPDDLRVRAEIRDGGETRPLELRGERRVIDRVELTYKIPLGVNLLKGPARVCVFGR